MKENELMVGDWVQTPQGIKGKIRGISYYPKDDRSNYPACYLIRLDLGPGSWMMLEPKDVLPIPLTSEILNTNGFIMNEYGAHVLKEPRFCVLVKFMDKIAVEIHNQISEHDDEKGRGDLVTYSRDWFETLNTHEFQQALRRCGIEKEITL